MKNEEWKNFKLYAIRHLWECEHNGWIAALYDSNIRKLQKNITHFIKESYLKYFRWRFRIIKKPVIPVLQYVVTTRCTMNCKHCNTLIPYFTNKTHLNPVSFEQYKEDLDNLLKSIDFIQLFGFVGGEPLLNKDLDKMIEYACSQKKIKHVFVATNCTIIPDEKLLKAFSHKKVGIQISNYTGITNIKGGITAKHYEVKELLQKNNVYISNPHEPSGQKNWQTMPKMYPDLQDEKEVKKNYKCCYGRFCYMFADGLLLQCTACVYMARNLELTKNVQEEIVDVRATKNSLELTNNIIKFLSKDYSQFCHYCHFDDMQYGLPCGEQAEVNEEKVNDIV